MDYGYKGKSKNGRKVGRPRRMDRDVQRGVRDEREQRHFERMEALLGVIGQQAVENSASFGITEGLVEAEQARQVALNALPPQPMAAIAATRLKADLMGLIVNKQAVAVGKPGDFTARDTEADIEAKLRDRFGEHRAGQVMRMVAQMRAVMDGDIIDGEATEISDSEA